MVELRQDDTRRILLCMSYATILAVFGIWFSLPTIPERSIDDLDLNASQKMDLYLKVIPFWNTGVIQEQYEGDRMNFRISLGSNHPSIALDQVQVPEDVYSLVSKNNEEEKIGSYELLLFRKSDLNNYSGAEFGLIKNSRKFFALVESSKSIESCFKEIENALKTDDINSSIKLGADLTIKCTFLGIDEQITSDLESVMMGEIRNEFSKALRPISHLVNFKLVFHSRMMQKFTETPEEDPHKKIMYFNPLQLTTLVQSGAWNLEEGSGDQAVVNMVLIRTKTPTYVRKPNGSLTNTFRYPKWGCSLFINDGDNTESIKSVLMGHLLKLLGFDVTGISPIDIDKFVINQIESAIDLQQNVKVSLQNLLVAETEIRMNKNICTLLRSWMDVYSEFSKSLQIGTLTSAYHHAVYGAHFAKSIFFDESLLGRMYFPNEHKLAIYGPLIVPTVLPVLFGLVKIALNRRYKQK